MSGQVCKEVKDKSGKTIGFEVVSHFIDGVDVIAEKEPEKEPEKKKPGRKKAEAAEEIVGEAE